MKKIIVCLLLVCIIGLGCITLASCDDGTDGILSSISYEPAIKCEFVKNEFQSWDSTYMSSTHHYERNIYTFRIWYSYEYYKNGAYLPHIKCTCPFIAIYYDSSEPDFRYCGETTIEPMRSADFYAEYLLGYDAEAKAIKPDSWIYFNVPIAITDRISEAQAITIELSNSSTSLAKYTLDLNGTYKTA